MNDLDFGVTIKGFAPGQKLFSRYTLVRILGRGGMGVVWLARDEELEREVALKFLPEFVVVDKEAIRDLKRETRRSLELTHPHIVRIYDVILDARSAAISMEYVPGDTLAGRKVDKSAGYFEPAEIETWVRQLLEALEYAHIKAEIVHRDLKPANLMVDRRGDLKIADFGIAANVSDSVSRVSAHASPSGTPLYMSPQQMMGERPAVTDDIYAFGATVYELLTGKPPFYAGNVILQVQNKPAPTMAARRQELGVAATADIPAAWEETIAACLAKEPADRPQSSAEVAERLGFAASSMKAQVGRVVDTSRTPSDNGPPGERPPAGKSRGTLLAAAAAAVVALSAAGYYFGIHAPEQARLAEVTAQQRVAREQAEAAAKAQAEAEQRAYAVILARIDGLVDGSALGVRQGTEAAVQAYLANAPGRDAQEVENRWTQRLAGWEAARLAAARGGIIVRTVPAGAEVTVGSLEHGTSPLTIREARLGPYPVRVRHAGYEDWAGELVVKENEFAEVHATLVRSTGTAVITSEPAGLAFVLSSAEKTERGTTPARLAALPTGEYTLMVQREGWPEQRQTLSVARAGEASGQARFLGGALEITSEPSGAEVWSEGKRLGVTPLSLTEQIPGNFEFEFRLARHRNATRSGQVLARQTTRVEVALEQIGRPRAGERFTVPDLDFELMPIAAGSFQMGNVSGGDPDERPVTRVTLSRPYWLGKTEVTQGQWRALMGNNPSNFKGDNLPVEQVSWSEAMEYCRKLTERERGAGRLPEGYVYTLPTEAQWEYAARAGTTGEYGGTGRLDEMGWYTSNSGESTKPAGMKAANAWGLHDMHGNVGEWCADWFGYYPGGSVTDPRGPGSSSGSYRVRRGGSWGSAADNCRSAIRWGTPDVRLNYVGFRVALSSRP
jgi:formylglycine-generating enzyme required for sulfatase activity